MRQNKRERLFRMQKEWFIDCYCGQFVAAYLEDGQLIEFSSEKEGVLELVGNIYKGKVSNVLTGMQAAFVSCGLQKNAYLSTLDGYADYSKYDSAGGTPKSVDLKEGEEVLVQLVKPQRGNKGARVSTQLSFVGRNLIYLPNSGFYGISRKITDEETKEKLLAQVKSLVSEGEGFIIRTLATKASKEQLLAEYLFLKDKYLVALEKAKTAAQGVAVHTEDRLPARVIRDYTDESMTIHLGSKWLYDELVELAKRTKGLKKEQLRLYSGGRSMMSEYGISAQIYEAANPTVPLKNGGYLVIDHTEAMTVVDVNSGSYVGSTSLEETALAVNLAATEEIARQVRLCNVGGIIAVDFIDMQCEEHKQQVTDALKSALLGDRTKCNVLDMNELCITHFTRKRVGSEALEVLVKPCKNCRGNGHVHTDVFTMAKIRDQLLQLFPAHAVLTVHLHEDLLEKVLEEQVFKREKAGVWKEKRLYFVPHKTYQEENFLIVEDMPKAEDKAKAIEYK